MAKHADGTFAVRASWLFYAGCVVIALVGQVGGAKHWLTWDTLPRVGAASILELGGVVLAGMADWRRRLNERALAWQVLSAAVAAFAFVINVGGHVGYAAVFFGGISAVGYIVWIIQSGDRRRDALRRQGKLPPTKVSWSIGQWIFHPRVTNRAQEIAALRKISPIHALVAAREEITAERHHRAISRVVRKRLRASTDKGLAALATTTYDLRAISSHLAEGVDYAALAAILVNDLDPEKLLAVTAAHSSGAQVVIEDAQVLEDGAQVEAHSAQVVSAIGAQAHSSGAQVEGAQRTDRAHRSETHSAQVRSAQAHSSGEAHSAQVIPLKRTGVRTGEVDLAQLCATLRRTVGAQPLGRPKAAKILREAHSSCSDRRAAQAAQAHNAWVSAQVRGSQVEEGSAQVERTAEAHSGAQVEAHSAQVASAQLGRTAHSSGAQEETA